MRAGVETTTAVPLGTVQCNTGTRLPAPFRAPGPVPATVPAQLSYYDGCWSALRRFLLQSCMLKQPHAIMRWPQRRHGGASTRLALLGHAAALMSEATCCTRRRRQGPLRHCWPPETSPPRLGMCLWSPFKLSNCYHNGPPGAEAQTDRWSGRATQPCAPRGPRAQCAGRVLQPAHGWVRSNNWLASAASMQI